MFLLRPVSVLVSVLVSLSSAVTILTGPPLTCSSSQQGLACKVDTSNCLDSGWLRSHDYTPSGPEELQVSVGIRQDAAGHLQPVLEATWKIKDDGSIRFLKATELQVLVTPTNENLCVRYSFQHQLLMRNPSGKKWVFSADKLVLDPGQKYHISVFNIPKPEINHSSYDVSADVTVPGCQDPRMQRTQFCIERGSLWQPNISMAQISADGGRPSLAVSFSPDSLCEEYIIIISSSTIKHSMRTHTTNQTSLNVTFSLEKWPRSCCQFDAEIKPLFPKCGQDCVRRRRTLNICRAEQADASHVPPHVFVVVGLVFMCVVFAVFMFFICRKPGKPDIAPQLEGADNSQRQTLQQSPKVLVIYSQDHHLYRDVVLKLCAFLQARCGTKVLVDLLDSASVSMVGRLRWLEWQRQQLKHPNDKILILCSPGVQAKWKAMCGQGRVTLKEDVLSPTDDMLTPFLNLFLPDMHHAGMHGKYMVAYFDDISSEQDVPSVFDIAVKFKLMKHFEELYFRILDMEKYQPDKVNCIEGIGKDEYFTCPPGKALKNAIETFRAYQLENPDWFEKQCVDCEEEVITEANTLINQLHVPPILECVPVIRDGLPGYVHEVAINESGSSVLVLTPELNTESELPSVAELTPLVNTECRYTDPVLTGHMCPHVPGPESVYIVEPVLNRPPPPTQNLFFLQEEDSGHIPAGGEEENSLTWMSRLSSQSEWRSSALQNSLDSNAPQSSCARSQSEYFSHCQPVEMGENEVPEPNEKGQSSGSDQGYISKLSSQHEPAVKEDPLVALRRLQNELLQGDVTFCDTGPEEN